DRSCVKRRRQQESCNCHQSSSVCLRECHLFLLRCIKIEVIVRYTTLTVTSMLPRFALEYAQVSPCVASTMARAISRSRPGRLTLSRAWRKYTSPELHRSISASTAASPGSLTFILLATSPIALMKQADQPAANNCSGLVTVPGTPGAENLTSKRPSSLREAPPRRPPELWVLAVYSTFITFSVEPATAWVS